MKKPKKKSPAKKKITKKPLRKSIQPTPPEDEGWDRLDSHWDRRHRTEKGYGGPFRSPNQMQDSISPEARHWQEVRDQEGEYHIEKAMRRKRPKPPEVFGQEMNDIEQEAFGDEDYKSKRKSS